MADNKFAIIIYFGSFRDANLQISKKEGYSQLYLQTFKTNQLHKMCWPPIPYDEPLTITIVANVDMYYVYTAASNISAQTTLQ